MKEVVSISIICLGNWNKKIFTPNWVTTKLFELGPNVKFNALINPDEMEFGFTHKDVLLLPKDNSLEINLDKITDESKKFGGVLLNRILTLLPHTPIKAIGINVKFSFNRTEKYKLVETLNEIKCKLNDFETNQIKFSKNLEDCQLNIITDISADKYLVNFNYHYTQIENIDIDIIKSKFINSQTIIKNE